MGAKPVNLYVGETEEKQDKSEEIRAKDIAVMTLDLSEGLQKLGGKAQSEEDKYAGKSYFPYVTPYSQTNTGFTPAPEENDRVALYFPSENESHALVIGAVNNDGNGRFTNPDKRNFTLGPSQASKGGNSANEGKPMYNFIMDKEKFIIDVGSIIQLTSKGFVNIKGKSVDVTGSQKLTAKGNENAEFSSQDSKLALNPSNGTLKTSNKIDIQSTETNVVGTAKTNVKGGKVKIY
jgi:hypothetical protein